MKKEGIGTLEGKISWDPSKGLWVFTAESGVLKKLPRTNKKITLSERAKLCCDLLDFYVVSGLKEISFWKVFTESEKIKQEAAEAKKEK